MSAEHVITTVGVPKMDTPTGLYTWVCSCGRRGNALGSERHAEKAGAHHVAGMAERAVNGP